MSSQIPTGVWSHDNAIASGAAKYGSHNPTVNSRLADLSDGATVVAGEFGNRHVEREKLAQKSRRGVSIERQTSFFLVIHDCSLQIGSCACGSETFRLDKVALITELEQRFGSRFDEAGRTANEDSWPCRY